MVIALVAAPPEPLWYQQAQPVALGLPGLVLVPWEGELCLFLSSFSPEGLSLPVSLLICLQGPTGHQGVGFSVDLEWLLGSLHGEEGGNQTPTADVQLEDSLPPFSETTVQRFLNTQFNLKQAQVQTIHKSF